MKQVSTNENRQVLEAPLLFQTSWIINCWIVGEMLVGTMGRLRAASIYPIVRMFFNILKTSWAKRWYNSGIQPWIYFLKREIITTWMAVLKCQEECIDRRGGGHFLPHIEMDANSSISAQSKADSKETWVHPTGLIDGGDRPIWPSWIKHSSYLTNSLILLPYLF